MTDTHGEGASIVQTFVDTLEFKRKKVGGVDELDALGKIEELAGLYEERIGQLTRALSQAKREAETAAAKQAAPNPAAEAELARAKAQLAEEHARAEGLAAKLRACEQQAAAVPSSDDFMRTLQEVRADVLAKARNEAASIVASARESAESLAAAERERRSRAVESARQAHSQAESAMLKLADALSGMEALEAGLADDKAPSSFAARDLYARLRRPDVPNPADPWDQTESR